jgi:hypothetical protein
MRSVLGVPDILAGDARRNIGDVEARDRARSRWPRKRHGLIVTVPAKNGR